MLLLRLESDSVSFRVNSLYKLRVMRISSLRRALPGLPSLAYCAVADASLSGLLACGHTPLSLYHLFHENAR